MSLGSTITCPHCSFVMASSPQFFGQTVTCPSCNGPFFLPVPTVQFQPTIPVTHAVSRRRPAPEGHDTFALWAAVVGVVLTSIGVFCPIVSAPIIGSLNFFGNGRGDGVILLVAAGLAALAILPRWYSVLWLVGIIDLFITTHALFAFTSVNQKLKQDMPADNVFAQAFAMTVQLQWGWVVMIIGAVAMIVAASANMGRNLKDKTMPILAGLCCVGIGVAAGFAAEHYEVLHKFRRNLLTTGVIVRWSGDRQSV